MGERTEFNTGKAIEINKIEPEKMSLAISEWAEGDETLRETITTCIENSIPTWASCSGHKFFDYPYLSIVVTPENSGRILNIMNVTTKMKGVQTDLSFRQSTEDEDEYFSTLTIHANMLNKKQCFENIASAAQSTIEAGDTSQIVQTLWETHQTLKSHKNGDDRFCNSLVYHNGMLSKKIWIFPYAKSMALDYIIEEAKMSKRHNVYGQDMYINSAATDKRLIKKLNLVKREAETYPKCKEEKIQVQSEGQAFAEDEENEHENGYIQIEKEEKELSGDER